MLLKNFVKDLKATAPRLVSVIIIAAVAVLMYVGFNGLAYNGEKINNAFFSESKVADYWISGQGLDKTDYYKVKSLESVSDIQPRIALETQQFDDEGVSMTLYGIDSYNINKPYIYEGNFPESNRDMMISKTFADKHGLSVGDQYEMLVNGSDTSLKLRIAALVKSPEYIGWTDTKFNESGYAYVNEKVLSDIKGQNVYTQFCIRKKGTVSDTQLKSEVNAVLGNKVTSILALKDNMDAYGLMSTVEIIKVSTVVLPIIFFLVATLIMFSTMKRMIENSRSMIGTLKALGYSDGKIKIYFLSYALMVVVAGYLIGALPANAILTVPAAGVVLSLYDLPPYAIGFDGTALLTSFIMVNIFCTGTAFLVTRKSLKEQPAECMRPRPPKKSKKILLERIPFLWKRLGFMQKYIIRSMFRGKLRMVICVFGVAGCMALTLTSFGMNNSIDNFTRNVTEKLSNYDVSANFERNVTESQYKHLKTLSGVTDVQYEMTTGARLLTVDKKESTALSVTEDVLKLKLIDPEEVEMAMPANSAVLAKKLSDDLDIQIGDIITLEIISDNKTYEMKVSAISQNIHGISVSKTYWRSMGGGYAPTTAYFKTNDLAKTSERLSGFEFVSSIKGRDEMIKESTESLQSILMIVFIFILFGGILALVVLYNLGIMNFFEQTRNLATLQVLGFREKEIKKLMLTENTIFTAIGVIVGIPCGMLLSKQMIGSMGSMEMDVVIKLSSYVMSCALTMLFAIAVNKMLGRKMKTIDMLGSLKSVE